MLVGADAKMLDVDRAGHRFGLHAGVRSDEQTAASADALTQLAAVASRPSGCSASQAPATSPGSVPVGDLPRISASAAVSSTPAISLSASTCCLGQLVAPVQRHHVLGPDQRGAVGQHHQLVGDVRAAVDVQAALICPARSAANSAAASGNSRGSAACTCRRPPVACAPAHRADLSSSQLRTAAVTSRPPQAVGGRPR